MSSPFDNSHSNPWATEDPALSNCFADVFYGNEFSEDDPFGLFGVNVLADNNDFTSSSSDSNSDSASESGSDKNSYSASGSPINNTFDGASDEFEDFLAAVQTPRIDYSMLSLDRISTNDANLLGASAVLEISDSDKHSMSAAQTPYIDPSVLSLGIITTYDTNNLDDPSSLNISGSEDDDDDAENSQRTVVEVPSHCEPDSDDESDAENDELVDDELVDDESIDEDDNDDSASDDQCQVIRSQTGAKRLPGAGAGKSVPGLGHGGKSVPGPRQGGKTVPGSKQGGKTGWQPEVIDLTEDLDEAEVAAEDDDAAASDEDNDIAASDENDDDVASVEDNDDATYQEDKDDDHSVISDNEVDQVPTKTVANLNRAPPPKFYTKIFLVKELPAGFVPRNAYSGKTLPPSTPHKPSTTTSRKSSTGKSRSKSKSKSPSTACNSLAGKPKSAPWSDVEDQACIKVMRVVCVDPRFAGKEERFKECHRRLTAQYGMDRSSDSVRLQWNRRIRAISGFDDRSSRKRTDSLATSLLSSAKSSTKSSASKRSTPSSATSRSQSSPSPSVVQSSKRKFVEVEIDDDEDDDEDDDFDSDPVIIPGRRRTKKLKQVADKIEEVEEELKSVEQQAVKKPVKNVAEKVLKKVSKVSKELKVKDKVAKKSQSGHQAIIDKILATAGGKTQDELDHEIAVAVSMAENRGTRARSSRGFR